jgi:hypothetical protein
VETARDFASSVPVEVPWLASPWIAKGALTEVGGKVKQAGKTTWVLSACRAVLDGTPFLNSPTRATSIVYLTEQSGSSFREALRRAGLADRDDFHIVRWNNTLGMEWSDVVRQAATFAHGHGAELMVVDTLGQFARIDGDAENSAGAALAAMEPLQTAASHGLAVVVVRHERKSGGDVGDSTRGSSAFAGAVDIVLAIRRPEGGSAGNVRVIHALSRFDETPDKLVIEMREDGTYEVLGDEAGLSLRMAREFLTDALPRDSRSACALAGVWEKTKLPHSALYEAAKQLVAEDVLGRDGEGKRGSPFRFWVRGFDSSERSPLRPEE